MGTKKRIYELAKELEMSNHDLVVKAQALGLPVSNHMSALEVEDQARLRRAIEQERRGAVVEKRIGSGIIRRRAKREDEDTTAPGAGNAMASAAAAATAQAEADRLASEAAADASEAAAAAETAGVAEAEGDEQQDAPDQGAEAPTPRVVQPVAAPHQPAQHQPAQHQPAQHQPAQHQPAQHQPTQNQPAQSQPPQYPPSPYPPSPYPPSPYPPSPYQGGQRSGGQRPGGQQRQALPTQPPANPANYPPPPARGQPAMRGQAPHQPPPRGPMPPSAPAAPYKPLDNKKVSTKQELSRRDLYEIKRDLMMGTMRPAKKKKPTKAARKTEITTPKAIKRVLKINESINISELAKQMSVKAGEVIMKLMSMGMMATVNQAIDVDTASLIAHEFGYEVQKVAFEEDTLLEEQVDADGEAVPRPPVVTIMGHVDHGKTSLLDRIRKTRVAEGEAGGITQHIGAYKVKTAHGEVSFLDTPGHEAFTQMRARGAMVTDLVVLVVAADDGVMPQTEEAIRHAKDAEVPIMVAVNKVDKPGADPMRVRQELTKFELLPEAWGGTTIFIDVSAKTGQGVDTLLEMIALQTEVLELRANPNKRATGYVVEAKLEKGRGPVATLLIAEGTLKVGDYVVTGTHHGRVRALLDDLGRPVVNATPSQPVEVLGLDGVPTAGDPFNVVADEKQAKSIAEHRQLKARESQLAKSAKVSLADLDRMIADGDLRELKVIVKADVQGSAEAVTEAMTRLVTAQVKVRVIHSAVGGITESDVMLAAASNAIIVGFNVRPDTKVSAAAEQEKVEIRTYSIIYELVDEVKKAMAGLLAPISRELVLGRAEVRQTFNVPKLGMIAGCSVLTGKITRSALARLLRDNVVVFQGRFASLRRFKDDVREVEKGYECGIGIEGYNDLKPGDFIEAYEIQQIAAELSI